MTNFPDFHKKFIFALELLTRKKHGAKLWSIKQGR